MSFLRKVLVFGDQLSSPCPVRHGIKIKVMCLVDHLTTMHLLTVLRLSIFRRLTNAFIVTNIVRHLQSLILCFNTYVTLSKLWLIMLRQVMRSSHVAKQLQFEVRAFEVSGSCRFKYLVIHFVAYMTTSKPFCSVGIRHFGYWRATRHWKVGSLISFPFLPTTPHLFSLSTLSHPASSKFHSTFP